MSIAEKLTTVAENIPKVYKAGQASMVDESKIIEKTVSGAFISVDDVSEIPHSVGCKVSGKNLIPYPYPNRTTTIKGISFTDNGDGTITANGTATADAIYSPYTVTNYFTLKVGETYTVSDLNLTTDSTFSTHYLQFKYVDNDTNVCYLYGAQKSYTFTVKLEKIRFNIVVRSGQTVNNLVFKPQIELGKTATDYTPYINPEDVKVTRCGKNLIDETQIKPISANSEGVKRNGWELSGLDGTFTLSVGSGWSHTVPLAYRVVSVDGVFGNWTSLFGADRKKIININKGEKLLVYLYLGESVPNDTILLEKETSATEYEPYNGQTFIPNADGIVEGMTSISPYMNVFTDNADVTLDVTYRKSWGMQTEYDRFWDSCQNTSIYPKRCGPAHFAGTGWNNDTFKPKYDIKVSNGYLLFYNCGVKGDLVEILNGLGVTLDTSEATSVQYLFWTSRFTRVGEINLTGLARVLGNTSQAFSTSTLITIDKMIVNENNVFATNMFTGATKLANIIIEGTMADNISFPDSPLSKNSILSVFNALSDTITGKTLTLKLSAVNTAFETSEGAADGSTSEEWTALIATKSNWTISLL